MCVSRNLFTLMPAACLPACLSACSAAAHLGLPEGLLVAQGGSDAFIGMVGLGVVRAGQMAMLTGEKHARNLLWTFGLQGVILSQQPMHVDA